MCDRIARRLEDSVGNWRYRMWFDRSTRMRYHNGDHKLQLDVPNRFVADWIGRHFREDIRRAAASELGDDIDLRLEVCPESFTQDNVAGRHGISDANPADASVTNSSDTVSSSTDSTAVGASLTAGTSGLTEAATAAARGEPGRVRRTVASRNAGLNLRHRLDQFVVGPSNELAYAAASALVGDQGNAHNPLFIHGGCGLGKTHLLQGICHAMLQQNPAARVVYVTGEHFTNQFLTAVRSNKIDPFRKQMRQLDLLAIDDVHFIADKQATQQEFLHSFDAIELKGARVALASDSHPKLIQKFSAALVSRCVRGMVVEIRLPDLPTRLRIIDALAQRRGLTINPAGVQLLAARCVGSVREIEGTLARLHALIHLRKQANGHGEDLGPIGPSIVSQLYASESEARPKRVIRFDHILEVVCRELGIPTVKVLGNGRHRDVVLARAVVIYLARQLTSMSCPEIGAAMKRPSHSTIVTAANRMAAQIRDNQSITLPGTTQPASLPEVVERLKQAVLRA
ncbi:MAG: chromosomal replication initiator protein DnaA [Phycisphaeraceae bacterium]|nr:chromosomal replication initiator protein DnaA [Phycisphaeraceae bacterium]